MLVVFVWQIFIVLDYIAREDLIENGKLREIICRPDYRNLELR